MTLALSLSEVYTPRTSSRLSSSVALGGALSDEAGTGGDGKCSDEKIGGCHDGKIVAEFSAGRRVDYTDAKDHQFVGSGEKHFERGEGVRTGDKSIDADAAWQGSISSSGRDGGGSILIAESKHGSLDWPSLDPIQDKVNFYFCF